MCPVSQCDIISYTNWFLAVGVYKSLIPLFSFFSFVLLISLSLRLLQPLLIWHFLSLVLLLSFHLTPSLSPQSFALIAIFHTLFHVLSSFLKWRAWIMGIQMSAEIIIRPWGVWVSVSVRGERESKRAVLSWTLRTEEQISKQAEQSIESKKARLCNDSHLILSLYQSEDEMGGLKECMEKSC